MKKRPIHLASIAITTAILSMSGCTLSNQDARLQQLKAASTASPAGAAANAMSGTTLNRVPGSTVSGSTSGTSLGTATGYRPSQQGINLTTIFRGSGVSVIEIPNSGDVILVMPSNVQFSSGSTQLSPGFQKILNTVAEVLNEYPTTTAEIPGHTDSVGSSSYNSQLSAQRAQTVANYLATQGIDPARLQVVPYGEAIPIATNTTEKGRALNRRVEIILHTPS